VRGELGVAVVEGQEKCGLRIAECGMSGARGCRELIGCKCGLTRAREGCYLTGEHRGTHPRDAELAHAADAVITQYRRKPHAPVLPKPPAPLALGGSSATSSSSISVTRWNISWAIRVLKTKIF
jgi:hypothetical protein